MKVYIGIDNGISGSIGIIAFHKEGNKYQLSKMPIFTDLDYVKRIRRISRIDTSRLRGIFFRYSEGVDVKVLLERPMVNPTRFRATVSALRALEATLIVLETMRFPYRYIDSREWQRRLLPSGIKGTDNLKRASLDMAKRMFPSLKREIEEQGDGDGLLLAEYARITM